MKHNLEQKQPFPPMQHSHTMRTKVRGHMPFFAIRVNSLSSIAVQMLLVLWHSTLLVLFCCQSQDQDTSRTLQGKIESMRLRMHLIRKRLKMSLTARRRRGRWSPARVPNSSHLQEIIQQNSGHWRSRCEKGIFILYNRHAHVVSRSTQYKRYIYSTRYKSVRLEVPFRCPSIFTRLATKEGDRLPFLCGQLRGTPTHNVALQAVNRLGVIAELSSDMKLASGCHSKVGTTVPSCKTRTKFELLACQTCAKV